MTVHENYNLVFQNTVVRKRNMKKVVYMNQAGVSHTPLSEYVYLTGHYEAIGDVLVEIEYTNKLLRQYIPKKSIINHNTTLNLISIQMKINRRPRKNLGFEKPFELFYNFINQNVAFAS